MSGLLKMISNLEDENHLKEKERLSLDTEINEYQVKVQNLEKERNSLAESEEENKKKLSKNLKKKHNL